MLGIFERLAKASRSVVETVHGKEITIFPLSRVGGPNSAAQLSTLAPPYDTVGLFYENTLLENESKAQPQTGTGKMLDRSLIRTASIRLVEGKPFATEYIVRRNADGALFTITRFDPDGVGNVLASLGIAQSLPGG
ncbi:hypothetical protein [Rhizobium tumorigenes]|uniref:hypothetical protein n=1 Tax=Rhizobium tumorigenes TaxID=2041385 RepID=UPI00241D71FB|nr:hypothetical protein [Rhizobium tumorigenes]WFS01597.1 hypothetical protein PR016_02885 [Rhizobium tumorigenes]